MNNLGSQQYFFGRDIARRLALLLIVAIVAWAFGLPSFLKRTEAANVSSFSDLISQSAPSTLASSTIQFTLQNAINPSLTGQTLSIQLDPSGSAFTETFSTASTSQIYLSAGGTDYNVVTSCVSGNEVTIVGNYNGGANENLTFSFCSAGATISSATVVTIGVGPLWTNPGTTGSYVIRLGGTAGVTGDTRIAVVDNVRVTASVDTSFTFTVSGVATSTQLANSGTTTTRTSTAAGMPFGTLVPHQPQVMAQLLNVTTNANNGFVVTVIEDQDPTSGTGATIHLFKDGGRNVTPIAWTSPSNVLNATSTYGHFGITSDDGDLNGGEFNVAGSVFAGNFYATTTPRTVFSNFGPADGSTQNVGKATIGYAMEIGSLQPAGNDYTDTLTYVATPTF